MRPAKASPPEPEASQPFESFERLAKGLMAVPKKELDQKLTEHDRDKQSRKHKKKA